MSIKQKHLLHLAVILSATVISACSQHTGVKGFWDRHDPSITESNYSQMQDCFAVFAEMTSKASRQDALHEIETLLGKLKNDDVSYYIYEEWLEAAFYNLHSPCRDPELFEHAAAIMVSDGVLTDMNERIGELRRYNSLNKQGEPCCLPSLHNEKGETIHLPDSTGISTVLVVDASCRSCIGALSALSDTPGRHIAIYFGSMLPPQEPGWEYCTSPDIESVFDIRAAPFYFTIDKDGIVQSSYSIPPQPSFTTPESL